MLRGAQKQMIVVRTRDSRVFEEAYFVVRRCRPPHHVEKDDMLWEANRIIERSLTASGSLTAAGSGRGVSSAADGEDQPRFRRRGLLRGIWFGLGSLCGGGLVGLLWLFL